MLWSPFVSQHDSTLFARNRLFIPCRAFLPSRLASAMHIFKPLHIWTRQPHARNSFLAFLVQFQSMVTWLTDDSALESSLQLLARRPEVDSLSFSYRYRLWSAIGSLLRNFWLIVIFSGAHATDHSSRASITRYRTSALRFSVFSVEHQRPKTHLDFVTSPKCSPPFTRLFLTWMFPPPFTVLFWLWV